jgi:hypothetical protein
LGASHARSRRAGRGDVCGEYALAGGIEQHRGDDRVVVVRNPELAPDLNSAMGNVVPLKPKNSIGYAAHHREFQASVG